jgi:phage-related protein (TIGR01555 family)
MPKFNPTIEDQIKKDPNLLLDKMKNKEIKNLTPYRNADNWSNIMTGLHQAKDKTKYTTFSGYTVLDDGMLAELWVGDGLGSIIVRTPADDMTREWITITNDTDKVIDSVLDDLDAQQHINLVLKWVNLFGGGVTVLGINDGGQLEEPVNINQIKSVDWLRTYDRTECAITEFHFNMDKESKNFGELEYITIQPKYNAPYVVHIDRLLIWKGLPVPNRMETGNFYYWGMSKLQVVWNQLSNLGAGMDHIVTLLYEFVIGKYKIDGLSQIISENNKQQAETIMSIIEMAKSTINGVMLDSKDDYSRDSANVAGLADILDRFMMMLSGVTGIPITKLFGRSAAGMNATGEGDERNYFNDIKSEQKSRMTKNLMKLVNYINIGLGNKVSDPAIEYNSLFQQTQKEELECKKLQMEIDVGYINSGVLANDEVAESRFGGEGYSYDTEIDMGNRELEEESEKEQLQMELALANKEIEKTQKKELEVVEL